MCTHTPPYTHLSLHTHTHTHTHIHTPADAIKKLTREIVSVIKTLRKVDDIYSKNPIPRLLKLMDHDVTTNDPFLRPHATFVSLFLLHQGVFYLTIAMESNRSAAFIENALT